MRQILEYLRNFAKPRAREKATWGQVDEGRARQQGWSLARAPRGWQLQKAEGQQVFRHDEHVWLFVHHQLECGDPLAARAFAFLEENAPEEFELVTRFCRMSRAA